MKKIISLILFVLLAGRLYAQVPVSKPKASDQPPLPFREVSGIVKDTADNTIIGASVLLTSKKDTLRTVTNNRGIFILKNVKLATFVITVNGLGFNTSNRKLLYSDLDKKLVLDPFILGTDTKLLKQVDISGVTPIVYKDDTTEYRASNYKVRENATVDELLKKMEDVEVDKNGKVTYQGEEVKEARLNGKAFLGGDVATVIKTLPANIVDKAQFINDYGVQAERTGIKEGDPKKVLNLTTKSDRSIGNIARLTTSGASNNSYEEQGYYQRLNANQQIAFTGNVRNSINGLAGSNDGSSGGSTTTGRPTLSYNDQLGKKLQVNGSYGYNFYNSNQINSSDGQNFSSNGTTNFNDQSTSDNHNDGHNLNFSLQYSSNKTDFLNINTFFYSSALNSTNASAQSLTGFQNQYQTAQGSNLSTSQNLNTTIIYQHIFKKEGRNVSLQASIGNSNQQQTNDSKVETLYKDSMQVTKKDSLHHFIVGRGNLSKNYSTNATYTEPLSKIAQIDVSAAVTYRLYDNTATTDSITMAGIQVNAPSLSNIYNYSFTEGRFTLNYHLGQKKFNLSLGVTAVPTILQGTQVSLNATTYHTNFNVIPVMRFTYTLSQTQKFAINYAGYANEPSFNQIQPVTDKSNPQNVIVGNPDLKPSFRHTVSFQYNNYIPNSKVTLSLTGNTGFTANQVITNIIQVPIPTLNSFYNEDHYLNMDGGFNANGNYGISKQLSNKKYNFRFNGSINYSSNISMSNSVLYHSESWRYSEHLGPRLNPNDWLEINPSVSYTVARSFFTQPNAINTIVNTTALSVDGVFTLPKLWRIGYTADKKYVEGLSANITHNPFVVDAYIEKTFFKKKNGILKLQMFDILNQNNFIDQSVTDTSITNSKSNISSRYLFVSFIFNMQKWSGTPKQNGQIMQRRGDGSFVY